MLDSDDSLRLISAVGYAYANKQGLSLCGSGSKNFLGGKAQGDILSLTEHSGIIDYQPGELVLTARAGTRLDAIVALLKDNGQQLPFDPPGYGGQGTFGGALATGLSGPARVWQGSARDAVLGMRIVNGLGQHLNFGGQVLKNVAGYDVSRLMVGAFGTLGLVLSASVRLLPLPAYTRTVRLEMNMRQAHALTVKLLRSPVPLSATCLVENSLYLRFSGSEAGVSTAANQTGGETVPGAEYFWDQIRDHKHAFFTGEGLWRFSLPPAADYPEIGGEWLTEWAGAQRWLKTGASSKKEVQMMFDSAEALGGHLVYYRSGKQLSGPTENILLHRFSSLSPALVKYHQNLKQAFDPAGILNAGHMHPDI